MKKKNLFLTLVFLLATLSSLNAGDKVYFFSYFMGNGEDGLHLAYSRDGLKWTTLNNDKSFLTPVVGVSKLMRDPCIIRTKDGVFHMVWTAGWTERGIGYASSRDLINWSEQKYIEVMANEPTARNTWAPEIIYDEKGKQFLIYWSTTVPGRFPETEAQAESKYNHRIYCTTTKDFVTFSETKLFYEPGFNVIDATIQKNGKGYIMFLKDETVVPPQKNIKTATSNSLYGPYSKASVPITGKYWAEGPSALKIGKLWYVYFDKYRDRKYGAVTSADLVQWTDISDKISFPGVARHGTVFEADEKILETLLSR
jgi:beta-xylosidase